MATKGSWPAEYFSQANPKGVGQGDVPGLLRRVADTVETLGEIEVLDAVLRADEITSDGPWFSMTVYFTRPSRASS